MLIDLIDEYYYLFLRDDCAKNTQSQRIAIYKKYIDLIVKADYFEHKIIDFFDLNFLKDDDLWCWLISNEDRNQTKIKLCSISPKIVYAINHLPKIVKLLDYSDYNPYCNILEQTDSTGFEKVTFFISKKQQSIISEKLLLMLQAVENLYNSTSAIEGASNIKLELVTCDFNSERPTG